MLLRILCGYYEARSSVSAKGLESQTTFYSTYSSTSRRCTYMWPTIIVLWRCVRGEENYMVGNLDCPIRDGRISYPICACRFTPAMRALRFNSYLRWMFVVLPLEGRR